MKTLEDALSALAALENGSELVEAVKGHTSKVNNEAKNLRDRLRSAESKSGGLKKFYELHGLDEELDDIDSAIEQIKTKQTQTGSHSERQVKALEARIKAQEDRVKTIEQERDQAIEAGRKERAGSELTRLLNENKVKADVFDGLKDVLMLNVKFDDLGNPVYASDDGTNVPIVDGVKRYLSANPGFITNDQNPGGGGNGGGGGDGKTMKRTEFDAMPSAKARAAFVNDGGTVTD